jgi:hypothetical protein
MVPMATGDPIARELFDLAWKRTIGDLPSPPRARVGPASQDEYLALIRTLVDLADGIEVNLLVAMEQAATVFHVPHAATTAADQLGGDHNAHWTAFGPTNVTLHRISAAYALGDAGIAIDHAATVPTATLRIPERQSRFWVDVARAYDQWNKPAKCYQALVIAERLAPEEVRCRPVVRSLAERLLSAPTKIGMAGLRDFAARVGATG